MRRIRTVTVSITPLAGDLISEVVAQLAPIDIVARLDSRDQLTLHLRTLGPDLVLIGLHQGEGDDIALFLRDALRRVKVIALSHDARHAYVHTPHRDRTVLTDMSPKALIEAIRGF